MKRHYNRRIESQETLREKIIGLGEESIHKNYFPELQKRLIELERFRFLVDQSSDIFIVADADSFIISDFSKSNRICFSNPVHSPLSLGEFFPEETILQLRKFINHLDQTGVNDKIIESELRSEDCPTIPVELSVSVIKNNADQLIVLIVRDITERKQNEIKIKRQIDRLTTLQKVEHAISSSLELNKVLETLKTELAHYMDITDVNVLLYDSLSKQLQQSMEPNPNSIQTEHETIYFANLSIQ